MNSFLDLASGRRSIRKYSEQGIPDEDIRYFISAAVNAPSGCDSQCWRFAAVRNRAVISKIKDAVIKKLEDILEEKRDDVTDSYLTSKRKMVTFFEKAPLVIAVFMTEAQYYDQILISALKGHGLNSEDIMKLFANYDLLSIGAAIQNLLLAVHEKGYGACWMNEPAIAAEDINNILGVPLENKFISLIPIGVPAYTPREKKLKSLEEVFTII
ncbi:nitroreductase family protein [Acetivibrio cellulolyticus]|uniref:nitroreductase family protein n=1 Tax=Acetivibrio cellulolyticus TaxID=35830 RepID=UPI0001E2C723|nr:nitroreductase family protein [Acetivibrio cellulolyticus]